MKDPQQYGKKKSRGRPPVIRIASNSFLTAREIVHKVGVTANVRSVLQSCENIKRLKMKRKPPLIK